MDPVDGVDASDMSDGGWELAAGGAGFQPAPKKTGIFFFMGLSTRATAILDSGFFSHSLHP
jgi:hypothetical protein